MRLTGLFVSYECSTVTAIPTTIGLAPNDLEMIPGKCELALNPISAIQAIEVVARFSREFVSGNASVDFCPASL